MRQQLGVAPAAANDALRLVDVRAFYSSIISAALAASQDDYTPSGFTAACTFLKLTAASGGSTLNGLVSTGFVTGQHLILRNPSTTDAITVPHLAGTSSAGNRFSCSGGVAAVLQPLTNALLLFDTNVWEFV